MATSYETAAAQGMRRRSPSVTLGPLAMPAATAIGVLVGARFESRHSTGGSVVAIGVLGIVVLVAAVVRRRAAGVSIVLGLFCVGSILGHRAWVSVHDADVGLFEGGATLMADPVERRNALEVVVEIESRRYRSFVRGSSARRLSVAQYGDLVRLVGVRSRPDDLPTWLLSRHVVGAVDITAVLDIRPGSPATRAANRIRARLALGARTLRESDRALFSGLVYGDDRALPSEVVDDFRAAGLSHLTAVSGQNVAYVIAAASPLLRRLGAWPRWMATLAVIAGFALITRFEPSVLRASVMAAVGATAFVTGRDRSGIGLLGVALTGLLIVDPMLVWSVGLWLSTGATAGLALFATPFERLLPGPRPLVRVLAASMAAQVGVMPVSALVFGLPSIVSLPANVAAVPVAGAVMLVGIPIAMVGSFLPDAAVRALMLPCEAGVRWVGLVAAASARLAPPIGVSVVVWLALMAFVLVRLRLSRRTPFVSRGDA